LAPVVFSGAVFTRAYFQKIAQIPSLCNFYFTHAFLVTNGGFGLCGFLPDLNERTSLPPGIFVLTVKLQELTLLI
jgi:hypothetical protein